MHAALVSLEQRPLPSPICVSLRYTLTDCEVVLSGQVFGSDASQARFLLPVIAPSVQVDIPGQYTAAPVFFLTGGFGATEYTLSPDEEGRFFARLSL